MKSNKNYGLILFFCLTLSMFLVKCDLVESSTSLILPYFPEDEWRSASPDELGLDSSRLNKMEQVIISQDIGIDSIHIVRYGYLAYEAYYEYYNYTDLHHQMCGTKSIVSILIGIAQAEGFISNLDEPILDIFSDRNFSNVDSRKEAITIRHLLQKRSGLECNVQDVSTFDGTIDKHDYELLTNMSDNWDIWPVNPLSDLILMTRSPDWVQFVLDKPMVTDPGTEFYYNDGCSHLLSAIIQKKTGMNTESFAKQFLFDPLSITDYIWFNDSQSISIGCYGLWLRPFDMTKIGYLFLNFGEWNGQQIVPEAWVHESTQDYNVGTGYGYQWWLYEEPNYYSAIGGGGQYIAVIPEDEMVIVLTSSEFHNSNPQAILRSYILDSIVEDVPITMITTTSDTSSLYTSTSNISSTEEISSETTNFTSVSVLFCIGIVFFLKRRRS